MSTTRRQLGVAAIAALVSGIGGPAWAGIGDRRWKDQLYRRLDPKWRVLPPWVRPYSYSLEDMARITAAFNVSRYAEAPAPLPNTPFEILYEAPNSSYAFDVPQGKFIYVPVLYNDDSLPVIGDFPKEVESRRQLLKYWYSQRQFGVVTTDVVLDERTQPLDAGYVSGVRFPRPLPDGAKRYATVAAFIAPLPPGPHTVEIRAKATGDALAADELSEYFPDGIMEFSVVYTVNVY